MTPQRAVALAVALVVAVALAGLAWHAVTANTVAGCAAGLAEAKRTASAGVIHACDGLSPSEQDDAARRAGVTVKP